MKDSSANDRMSWSEWNGSTTLIDTTVPSAVMGGETFVYLRTSLAQAFLAACSSMYADD